MELSRYFRTSNDHRITKITLGPAVESIVLVCGLLRPHYGLALAAKHGTDLRPGSLYLTTPGLIVVVIMLLVPRGVWDLLAERFGITLVPIQRRRIGEPWTSFPFSMLDPCQHSDSIEAVRAESTSTQH